MTRWIALILGAMLLLTAVAHAADLGKSAVALDGRKVSSEETNLGNFVADAVRDASGADIAILHAMAFRANALIDQGVIDEQAIRGSIASPTSKIVTLKLTPALLRTMMQRALTKYPDANPAFLQFSGMQVTFDSSQPAATRVKSISVDGKALNLTDTKTMLLVAMPRELAFGAAGYVLDFTDDVTKSLQVTDVTVFDAITKEFQRSNSAINPVVEGRLKDANPKKTE